MATISFTPQQRQAVEATGCSLLVSAAAGSGKTAVLAERCAFLACDADPAQRCNIDELLVLTFTEAAAAEMRTRIVEALRQRSLLGSNDDRLQEQIALAPTAHISTIHAFCLWMIRRWFSELGVDPSATVLDADEAELLKRETLEKLFHELYAVGGEREERPSSKLGSSTAQRESWPSPVSSPCDKTLMELAPRFLGLVDDYGLGEEREIADLVLKLSAFTSSLPDPDAWLREAIEAVSSRAEWTVLDLARGLKNELDWQAEHVERIAQELADGPAIGHFHAEQIRGYGCQLRAWESGLAENSEEAAKLSSDPTSAEASIGARLVGLESVSREIAEFTFSRATGPRVSKDADPGLLAAHETAKARLAEAKKLFDGRLRKRFALFSMGEWIEGLKGTAPFVTTIVDLVRRFREEYTTRKRRLAVLDFADLERLAYELLRGPSDATPPTPSEAARSLRKRFAHVLVDEFQDINPIQQAIIALVSRESDPDRADNLFVVGDVKQSIYRFRLAEPDLFLRRMRSFRASDGGGKTISLQRNFRSRPEILDTVNLVFGQLMRGEEQGVLYDAEAELRSGRPLDASTPSQPVELHLLERRWESEAAQDDDGPSDDFGDPRDSAHWTPAEREAFLIGSLIREMVAGGRASPGGASCAYRDIAILLRAARITAERMAAVLQAMGIPTYAEASGSLFAALEVRGVLAALRVIDNPQQDIPLAAVLRGGLFSERLSEDELVEIRCVDREIAFHACVREYAARGGDRAQRDRVVALLARIDRYRRDIRRRPLAEVIWRLYEDEGLLAHAGGLTHGLQRRTNLLKLHDLARRFGTFRRQGLHRFLRFIEALSSEQRDIASAAAIGEGDDVVRVMSIHQSKGLEFPVVFVAGLGTKFNLGNRGGRMIFERQAGIGLRVVDSKRMVEYPSAAHHRVVEEVERRTREEELRILYVAMTRAEEKLILVGSMNKVDDLGLAPSFGRQRPPPTRLSIATAATALDWIVPALRAGPCGRVRALGDPDARHPTVEVQVHRPEEMAGWKLLADADPRTAALQRAVARGAALPAEEPVDFGDAESQDVLTRIEQVYPTLASATLRAAWGASEFKGTHDFLRDPEQRQESPHARSYFAMPAPEPASRGREDAARRGVVMHRVLQHLDFAAAIDARGVTSECQRLAALGWIAETDRALIDTRALEWFVTTPLAERMRQAGDRYRREFPYIATESPQAIDPTIDPTTGDRVLVRGIVDGVLPYPEAVEIVDFKTDAIRGDQVAERVERYHPQMRLYAGAMATLWRRPVRACWLVFLAAREVATLSEIARGDSR